jgi:hypothetical protein
MSSLDPPSAGAESARRDMSLINRGRRDARRRRDFRAEHQFNQMGDAMGLPAGRTQHAEEIRGVGEARDAMANYTLSRPPVSPVDGFRRAWQQAKTQDEKDAIVEAGHGAGIQLSPAGMVALQRRQKLSVALPDGQQGPAALASQIQPSGVAAGGLLPPPVTGAPQPPAPQQQAPAYVSTRPTQEESNLFRFEQRQYGGRPGVPALDQKPVPGVNGQQMQALAPLLKSTPRALPVAQLGNAGATGAMGPPQMARPQTFETAAQMRARIDDELAPSRQRSAEAIPNEQKAESRRRSIAAGSALERRRRLTY